MLVENEAQKNSLLVRYGGHQPTWVKSIVRCVWKDWLQVKNSRTYCSMFLSDFEAIKRATRLYVPIENGDSMENHISTTTKIRKRRAELKYLLHVSMLKCNFS